MDVAGGEPTLGEVARTLDRIETELKGRLDDFAKTIALMVTRDLYEAHRTAMQDDIKVLRDQLDKADERRTADRRMLAGALIAAALSLIVTVAGAALVLALGLGG